MNSKDILIKVNQLYKIFGNGDKSALDLVKSGMGKDELLEKSYDDVIDRLKDERDRLERDLRHEYRNARRYVRANPEQGIGIAIAAGLALGILLGRASK